MAKAILIQNMDDKCNEAINKKRAQLLLEGKDFKKSEVVVEILHEWLEGNINHNIVTHRFNASEFAQSVTNQINRK
jgi:hypothetical protein